jgi:GTPase KRas protein
LTEGRTLAESWGAPFFETSAKEKINNEACFFELVRCIRRMDKDAPSTTKKKSGFCNIL